MYKDVKVEVEIDSNFEWESIDNKRVSGVKEDELYMSYLRDKSKTTTNPLMFLRFGGSILKYLDAKLGEKLIVMSDKNDPYNYLLMKGMQGYKIQQDNCVGAYKISFRYLRKNLPFFKITQCTYFVNKNNSIRIVIPRKFEDL